MESRHPEFEALCGELLDGCLDEDGSRRLAELVAGEPALQELLREHLAISGALARENPMFNDERFETTVSTQIRALGDEPPETFPTRIHKRLVRHRRRQIAFAIAACLALAALPLLLLNRGAAVPPRPPAVAIATTLPDDAADATRSSVIESGDFVQLDSGTMRLEFGNGAVVAVGSPARFTVQSAEEILLESGNLNAWCPESAHGFRVNTRSAQLKDLGTSFGVSALPDGSADFVVLEGEVEVTSQGKTRNLLKGAALRATKAVGLEDVAFETSAFARTWPVASGIQRTTGKVVPAPPNTPEMLAKHEDDKHVLVIPEKRSFELPATLPADIREPGAYGAGTGNPLGNPAPLKAPPGTRARSYLIRYNPVGILDFMVFRRFEGSVTFDRPVLAIITGAGKLDATDSVTSHAPLPKTEEEPTMRGLEAGPKTDPDWLSLSRDRRTVSILFNAGESVDEIRVITAAD